MWIRGLGYAVYASVPRFEAVHAHENRTRLRPLIRLGLFLGFSSFFWSKENLFGNEPHSTHAWESGKEARLRLLRMHGGLGIRLCTKPATHNLLHGYQTCRLCLNYVTNTASYQYLLVFSVGVIYTACKVAFCDISAGSCINSHITVIPNLCSQILSCSCAAADSSPQLQDKTWEWG